MGHLAVLLAAEDDEDHQGCFLSPVLSTYHKLDARAQCWDREPGPSGPPSIPSLLAPSGHNLSSPTPSSLWPRVHPCPPQGPLPLGVAGAVLVKCVVLPGRTPEGWREASGHDSHSTGNLGSVLAPTGEEGHLERGCHREAAVSLQAS